MSERERRALTDDKLDAERGMPLPDRGEMSIINPQPMPPSYLPPGQDSHPVIDSQPIPANEPSTANTA